MKRTLTALIIVLAACGGSAETATTTAPSNTDTTLVSADQVTGIDKPTADEAKLKLGLVEASRLARDGVAMEEIATRLSALQFDENGVLVEVTFGELTDEARAAAIAAGLHVSADYPDRALLTGSIDPGGLLDLAAMDAVESVDAALGFSTN